MTDENKTTGKQVYEDYMKKPDISKPYCVKEGLTYKEVLEKYLAEYKPKSVGQTYEKQTKISADT